MTGCHQTGEEESLEAKNTRDSLALHVGVIPTWECMPVLYAQKMGIADSMGLDMIIEVHNALMDMDTAVMSGRLEVFWEDSLRVVRMPKDSLKPEMILPTPTPLWLIANKTKRVRKTDALKEHMVAGTRWSGIDEWITQVIDEAGIDQVYVNRPQVNDIFLRCRMVRDALVDCAVLPAPYNMWATAEGHKTLAKTKIKGVGFYTRGDVMKDSLRKEQIRLFEAVYKTAQKQIKEGGNKDSIRTILKDIYQFDNILADTLSL